MPREIIKPEGIWDPSPRFSQVSRHGNTVYVAGQTSVDADGNVVGKGDIEAQARQVFENIKKCLASVGATFANVVKINIYSTDIDNDITPVSKVRSDYFDAPVPSTYVQVPRLVHPDWLLEIEAVAMLD